MILGWHPWKIIGLGFSLVLLGVLIPLLIILQVIRSTLFLNFLSYSASTAGMIVGFIGMTFLVRVKRSQSDEEQYD